MSLQVKKSEVFPVNIGDAFFLPCGHGCFAIVDPTDWLICSRYRWRLTKSSGCWYVSRKHVVDDVCHTVFLHRFISKPKADEQAHHKNHFTLDCRRSNLENLSPQEHARKNFLSKI
jgi:hypothetical protein